jgi:hypothetical protein
MVMDADMWTFLPIGFLLTICIETVVLVVLLSRRHRVSERLLAGVWLTACTYPIVILVLPALLEPEYSRSTYLWIAETFAPAAECGLFWLAYGRALPFNLRAVSRDCVAIVAANLASFGTGLLLFGT